MVSLNMYLILSAVLFSIGTAGVFLRRNLITILLSIEIMLNAVNLTFVAVGRYLGTVDGQIITMFDPVSHLSTASAGASQSVISASAASANALSAAVNRRATCSGLSNEGVPPPR